MLSRISMQLSGSVLLRVYIYCLTTHASLKERYSISAYPLFTFDSSVLAVEAPVSSRYKPRRTPGSGVPEKYSCSAFRAQDACAPRHSCCTGMQNCPFNPIPRSRFVGAIARLDAERERLTDSTVMEEKNHA